MNRDYLIERMKRTQSTVIDCVHCLPAGEFDSNQKELVESIEYILLDAFENINTKIAEYRLKTA
jgi:hypothetical protein